MWEFFLKTRLGINCEKLFRLKHVTEWLRWVMGSNLFLHNLLIPIRLMYVLQLLSHTPPPQNLFPAAFLKSVMTFRLIGGWVSVSPQINMLYNKPNPRCRNITCPTHRRVFHFRDRGNFFDFPSPNASKSWHCHQPWPALIPLINFTPFVMKWNIFGGT